MGRWFLIAALVVACDGPAPTEDGGARCASDRDCDDRVFCNGAELCDPSDPSADARGCAPAREPRCAPSQTCDEALDACITQCEVDPDADGDGHDAIECGGTDCDDADRNRYPGNAEVCDPEHRDEDCDPFTFGFRDSDRDGFPDVRCCNLDGERMHCGTDCDDANATVHPGAAESCDLFDNDCDGFVDEGLPSFPFHPDCDGDLFGAAGTPAIVGCRMPDRRPDCPPERIEASWATNARDCDDEDASRNPAAPEVCNGVDDDCNGLLDGPGEDDDRDGYADDACAGAGGRDCDDTNRLVYRGAPELCDGVDTDCDGTHPGDELDLDGDGYVASTSCIDASLSSGDCDDSVAGTHRGAAEACNARDDDCDGMVDEGLSGCDGIVEVVATMTLGRSAEGAQRNRGFACALRSSGLVQCWGDAREGSLGDGGALLRSSPGAPVSGLTDAIDIDAGGATACAVRASGGVSCWGSGDDGQLGDGSTSALTPVDVVGVSDAVSVAVGVTFACALRAGGSIACWGRNDVGQLGNGTTADAHTPVTVEGITTAVAITAGSRHACAVLADRTARCWGHNAYGRLGDGTTVGRRSPVAVLDLTNVTTIDAGGEHTCAIAGGRAYCWGRNAGGELGIGGSSDRARPALVASLTNVRAISAGGQLSCARDATGTAYCWGLGTSGQIGDGSVSHRDVPTPVARHTDFVSIVAGSSSACGARAGGEIACWGSAQLGQLGDGTSTATPVPVTVSSIADAVSLAAGEGHTCAVHEGGTVSCWGSNFFGQLGDGTTTSRAAPVSVGLTGVTWIGAAHRNTIALVGSELWLWGWHNGQLADGSAVGGSITSPRAATAWGAVSVAAVGSYFLCAADLVGDVRCSSSSGPPNVLSGGAGVTQLTAGLEQILARRSGASVRSWDRPTASAEDHTLSGPAAEVRASTYFSTFWCARLESGPIECAGANSSGQLGIGTTSASGSGSPLASATSIGAGAYHACAIQAGRVLCWGRNQLGQLGRGTLSDFEATPAEVIGVTDATELALHSDHSCASLSSGQIRCWGSNGSGQLGDGHGALYSATPVGVLGLP